MTSYTPQTPLYALTEDGEIHRVVALLTEAPKSAESTDTEGLLDSTAARIMIHLARDGGGVSMAAIEQRLSPQRHPYIPAAMDSLARKRRITQMNSLWYGADNLTDDEVTLEIRLATSHGKDAL